MCYNPIAIKWHQYIARKELTVTHSTKIKVKHKNPSRRLKQYHKKKRKIGKKKKTRHLALFLTQLLLFFTLLGGVEILGSLQAFGAELPNPEDSFNTHSLASMILDRKGKALYKLIGNEARDPVELKDIPEHVKWAFIAAEDINFFTHTGVDTKALLRCGAIYLSGTDGTLCGGSTITQQLVKLTTLTRERTIERKVKEILTATKIEEQFSKEKILEQYLAVIPMGGNIYGVTTGAKFYFGKSVKKLTLAESALLAAIIQNPVYHSPTIGYPDPTTARKRVKIRQEYVLDQLEKYINLINNQIRENYQDPEMDDVFTKELITAAREEKLKYIAPIITDKKAGHFVDYVISQLTTRPYKNGQEAFTLEELGSGGYTIYTTLDYDLQKLAERTVSNAVRTGKAAFGAHNAAMMLMKPSSGEILAMVGSKSYTASKSGCNKKKTSCKFDPQVNIMTTKQSPGSSTKPFAMYEAYRTGKLFTGSLLPDIPINVGGGYNLKNWNGTFYGVTSRTYASRMLCESRNLPAVITVELTGIPTFLKTMKRFGYTTYNQTKRYGHSVVLGGADVIGVEHTQAYAVFANQGKFVKNEVVRKIVDSEGNVVFEYKAKPKKIADPKAAYMINHSLLNCFQPSWDGRHVAAKTGTSQNNADAWSIMWSPDFVISGWMGNNNNKPMRRNAFGVTAVLPWLKQYMRAVGDSKYFAKRTKFKRPAGLVNGGGKSYGGKQRGLVSGLMIRGKTPPADVFHSTSVVCKDQKNRLARKIDKENGFAKTISTPYYRMPVPRWQKFLDAYLSRKGKPNGGPVKYCTKERTEVEEETA